MNDVPSDAHEQAFEAFAEAAEDALGEHIHDLILFGSTVRGETRGRDSDVDVFVILDRKAYESVLREIAYDISLEYGVVVSLHAQTKDGFEERRDHPFIRTVLNQGRTYG